jgi:hypothetical protein
MRHKTRFTNVLLSAISTLLITLTLTACGAPAAQTSPPANTPAPPTSTPQPTATQAPEASPPATLDGAQTVTQLRTEEQIIADLNALMAENGLDYVIAPADVSNAVPTYFYGMSRDDDDMIIDFVIMFLGCTQSEQRALAQSVILSYAPELTQSEAQTLTDLARVGADGVTGTQLSDTRGVYFAYVPNPESSPGATFYVGKHLAEEKDGEQPPDADETPVPTEKPVYEQWPDNKFSQLLPKPDFLITKLVPVTVAGYDGFEVQFEGWSLERGKAYAAEIRDSYGFTEEIHEEDSSSEYLFGAKTEAGYQLRYYVKSDGSGSLVIND